MVPDNTPKMKMTHEMGCETLVFALECERQFVHRLLEHLREQGEGGGLRSSIE